MTSERSSIDASQWPILIIRIVPNDEVDFLVRSFEAVADLYHTRKEPYVTIIDASSGHRPSPEHRYLQTEFRRQHEDHVKK